jgi:hypothetical protein
VVLGGDWEASRRRYRERESEGKRKMGGWREKMDLGAFEGEMKLGAVWCARREKMDLGKCGGNVCARWRLSDNPVVVGIGARWPACGSGRGA